MPKRAAVLLAEGFEEIEVITVVDILRRADIDVEICALGRSPVKGAHGIEINSDRSLDDNLRDIDALVLPGGMPGANNLAASGRVKEIIQDVHAKDGIIAAICASPAIVLGPTGILNGKKATCYPGMEKGFNKSTSFLKDDVVLDGNIITSRGPGTAISFLLAIVEKLSSRKAAGELRKKILA